MLRHFSTIKINSLLLSYNDGCLSIGILFHLIAPLTLSVILLRPQQCYRLPSNILTF